MPPPPTQPRPDIRLRDGATHHRTMRRAGFRDVPFPPADPSPAFPAIDRRRPPKIRAAKTDVPFERRINLMPLHDQHGIFFSIRQDVWNIFPIDGAGRHSPRPTRRPRARRGYARGRIAGARREGVGGNGGRAAASATVASTVFPKRQSRRDATGGHGAPCPSSWPHPSLSAPPTSKSIRPRCRRPGSVCPRRTAWPRERRAAADSVPASGSTEPHPVRAPHNG